MPVLLGIDLGTTTITSLAVDAETGKVLALASRPHEMGARVNREVKRGYSEWDVKAIFETAVECLREVAAGVKDHRQIAGLGVTGQQHGVVLVDSTLTPVTALINWQDRRGEEHFPGTTTSYVEWARQRLGEDAPSRTGCRLATGYMAVTLLWLRDHGRLPSNAKACFLPDFFTARLTGKPPVTDPTCAASGGVLNLVQHDWDDSALKALELPRGLLPDVRPSAERLGGLTPEIAARTDLPAGLPICVGIGDNQASFLGSVAEPKDSVLVNVGTGGQVSVWTDQFLYDPAMETRPFPGNGFLLVSAGLCGGKSYALLERFFRMVGELDISSHCMTKSAAVIIRRGKGILSQIYNCRSYSSLTGDRRGFSEETRTVLIKLRAAAHDAERRPKIYVLLLRVAPMVLIEIAYQ